MKIGDLVRIESGVCKTYGRTPDDIGLVMRCGSWGWSPYILWAGCHKPTLFARCDFLEVVSEGR